MSGGYAASAEPEVFIATEARVVKTQKQLRLKIGATAIPHPEKVCYRLGTGFASMCILPHRVSSHCP